MSISSQDCKEAIIEFCKMNKQYICSQFIPQLNEELFILTTLTKNWKRETKEIRDDGITIRMFDCRPFDDQLRAYVKSNDNVIFQVEVIGE